MHLAFQIRSLLQQVFRHDCTYGGVMGFYYLHNKICEELT